METAISTFKIKLKTSSGIEIKEIGIIDSFKIKGRVFVVHKPHDAEILSDEALLKVSDYQTGLGVPCYFTDIDKAKMFSTALVEKFCGDLRLETSEKINLITT